MLFYFGTPTPAFLPILVWSISYSCSPCHRLTPPLSPNKRCRQTCDLKDRRTYHIFIVIAEG